MDSQDDHHFQLDQAFSECPGQWVAVDRRTGTVVAARPSPYELSAALRGSAIRNVDVVRAPDYSEPEMVGFG
jgi:hypothetical protein